MMVYTNDLWWCGYFLSAGCLNSDGYLCFRVQIICKADELCKSKQAAFISVDVNKYVPSFFTFQKLSKNIFETQLYYLQCQPFYQIEIADKKHFEFFICKTR